MCRCVYTDGMPGSSRDLTDVGACDVMTHCARTNSVNVNTDKACGRAISRDGGPADLARGNETARQRQRTAVPKVKVTGKRRRDSGNEKYIVRALGDGSASLTASYGFPSPAQKSRSSGHDRAFKSSVPSKSPDMLKRNASPATFFFFSFLRTTRSRTVCHVPTDRERRNIEWKLETEMADESDADSGIQ